MQPLMLLVRLHMDVGAFGVGRSVFGVGENGPQILSIKLLSLLVRLPVILLILSYSSVSQFIQLCAYPCSYIRRVVKGLSHCG